MCVLEGLGRLVLGPGGLEEGPGGLENLDCTCGANLGWGRAKRKKKRKKRKKACFTVPLWSSSMVE